MKHHILTPYMQHTATKEHLLLLFLLDIDTSGLSMVYDSGILSVVKLMKHSSHGDYVEVV